jgi:tRNA (cytidine/uridine-2'-O-)-methyltransferase
MLEVALLEPEIPPNTGNIIRLCANCGAGLHLIHPLGFDIDDRQLRRAGLDYHDLAHVTQHRSWQAFLQRFAEQRIFACSTKGTVRYDEPRYLTGDVLLFGPETRGLPDAVREHETVHQRLRIPMVENSRSLNLSNAVAVVLFEAWRQLDFCST